MAEKETKETPKTKAAPKKETSVAKSAPEAIITSEFVGLSADTLIFPSKETPVLVD